MVSLISDSNYFLGSDSGLLVAGNEAENGFPFLEQIGGLIAPTVI